jgi:hypothetical protein
MKSVKRTSQWKEQVRKRGLPPLLLGLDERGQAPLPDLFISYSSYVPFVANFSAMRTRSARELARIFSMTWRR